MREAFLKRLFSMVKCESCGHNYEVTGIEILGHEDNLWLFSASCSHCQNQGLVAIVVKEGKIGVIVTQTWSTRSVHLASISNVASRTTTSIP